MENTTKTNPFKIATIVLSVLLVGSLIYNYTNTRTHEQENYSLEKEKGEIQDELTSMISRYDSLIALNTVLDSSVLGERAKVEALQAELSNLKVTDRRQLEKYRRELSSLRAENQRLMTLAANLKEENKLLLDENQAITEQKNVINDSLQSAKVSNQELSKTNTELSQKVAAGKALSATSTRAEAVHVKSNGSFRTVTRAKTADQIRVCFTLAKNTIADPGNKEVYATISNPQGKVIGSKKYVKIGDNSTQVSGQKTVNYNGDNLDVCLYVDGYDNDITKGNYRVDLYADGTQIGNTQFSLK